MSAHTQTNPGSRWLPAETSSTLATRLQPLLDSFSGELSAYRLDCPAYAVHASGWDSLVSAVTILPEMADAGRSFIERRLGYRPPESTMQSQEAFLRALLRLRQTGHLAEEDFAVQADQCVKAVRNLDMQVPLRGEVPLSEALPWYEQYLPSYGPQARARLTHFLGEAPSLEHSLIVELWLRQVLAQDGYGLPDDETAIDRKAALLVTYRKVLAQQGRDAADGWPLPHPA